MTAQLNVAKVALGAFLIPWWNRAAFGRALVIPLAVLVTFTLSWYFAGEHLPMPDVTSWVLYVAYWFLFVPFAVTSHRLVLLDAQTIASRMVPRWSWRETRFFLWMAAVGLIFAGMVYGVATFLLSLWMPWMPEIEPNSTWFQWSVVAAKLPAFYVFGRLCLIFPATAVDRKVDLKWAWASTRKNGWRLVLIVGVLPWLVSSAVTLLYRENATALETIVLTVLGCALIAVEIAAISLSYRELTKGDAQGGVTAPH